MVHQCVSARVSSSVSRIWWKLAIRKQRILSRLPNLRVPRSIPEIHVKRKVDVADLRGDFGEIPEILRTGKGVPLRGIPAGWSAFSLTFPVVPAIIGGTAGIFSRDWSGVG